MPQSYPPDFPLSEIQTLTTITRSGNLSARKEEALHNAWHISGYCLGVAFPDKPSPVFAGTPACESMAELAHALNENSNLPTYGSMETGLPTAADLLALLLKLLPVLLAL